MRRTILFSCLVGSLFAIEAGYADEPGWPRFRGPNGDGIASNQDIPIKFSDKDGIAWKVPIAGMGNSSPIVWKNLLFLQSSTTDGSQRLLLCLDAHSGKELWTRSLPGKKSQAHLKNSLASSTPATDGEAVFASFWDGKEIILAAYSTKGDPLWEKNIGPWISEHGPGASPILYKDKVIFVNDMDKLDKGKNPVKRPSTLLALNKKTGAVVWEAQREAFRACYVAPFILEKPGGAPELVVTSSTAITSYNPDKGTENWNYHWGFSGKPKRAIAASFVTEGLLFGFSGDGDGTRQMNAIALDAPGGPKTVWQSKKDFPYVPCCLVSGPNIYFVNDGGFAGCFDAKTGKKVWFERLPDAAFTASPIMIDGKIYAASEQGDVFVFAAEPKFQLLAQNSLGGETIRATPAVSDGRLYIRGARHLYCISKRPATGGASPPKHEQVKGRSMAGKPDLKQFGDLIPVDFAKHPVWASVSSFDFDEAWFDDCDEETFRPWIDSLPVAPEQGMFLVHCKMTLADGRILQGFATPQHDGEEFNLGIIQPQMFLPSGQQCGFWDGMFKRSDDNLEAFYAELGKRPKSIFPIQFSAEKGLATGIAAGIISGFYWRPEDEIKVYV